MELWINPACSKCRVAKGLLDEAGASYTERRYLDDPPTADELDVTLAKLGLQPWDIARMDEQVAKDIDLAGLEKNREKWLAVLATHPILIQRPIIIDETRAVIGRSEDAVRGMLQA